MSEGGLGFYNDVQCIMGDGHVMTPSSFEHDNGQAKLKTLPFRNFVDGR